MEENRKRVELLSPAGNYEGFLGAIHAGADAVYLGGERFGARAFADNFKSEEIKEAIRYAHLWNRKVYLTINTLFKNRELEELSQYLTPFVEAGLDGVIIQDIGAFFHVKSQFPQLALHVSTQMGITGVYGAKLLKECGAQRIVPARELSLLEIKAIKQEVSIEIETFIHGAMCYCYSGNCLFSSILGGRSGNRGRCAQPCRLPYSIQDSKKEQYPLSLKDMCTLSSLPQLIEAGIDSFKIEGRMKKAEYTAGVTSLYRNYIDRYYDNPKAPYVVDQKDMELLQTLYMRSEIQDGYYDKHNGKEMITLQKPSYGAVNAEVLSSIRSTFITAKKQMEIKGYFDFTVGKQMSLTLFDDKGTCVTQLGDFVLEAKNQPMQRETIEKQLCKTGTSRVILKSLDIQIMGNGFVPLKALNELRRNAIEQLEETILAAYQGRNQTAAIQSNHTEFPMLFPKKQVEGEEQNCLTPTGCQVSVLQAEQFFAANARKQVSRIYFDMETLLGEAELSSLQEALGNAAKQKEICFSLPHLLRKRSYPQLAKIEGLLKQIPHYGVLVRNWEQLQWLREIKYDKNVITDANLYSFNKKSKEFLQTQGFELTAPYELNEKEWERLPIRGMIICVYGKIPMMITANCVANTLRQCKGSGQSFLSLTDRYQKQFPVRVVCNSCYNVIYNSVPLFLPKKAAALFVSGTSKVRIDFTTESKKETERILDYFLALKADSKYDGEIPVAEFTRGHCNRGVE